MNFAIEARRETWKLYGDAAAATVGFASPLYRAALRARLGRDLEGAAFAALAARLPSEDRRRLWNQIRKLEAARAGAKCAT